MTVKKAISKLNKLYPMLSDDVQLALETLYESSTENKQKTNTGTYQCFHCGSYSVSWDADFNPEDMGYDGEEGVIHICHCGNCGAEIEYRVFDREEEKNGKSI